MRRALVPALLLPLLAVPAEAALPVEREVQRESTITGPDRGRMAPPAGSVEYSVNGVTRRHFGPWVIDETRRDSKGEVIFLEDGSVLGSGARRDHWRHPDSQRHCTIKGNVTICR